MNIFDHLEMKIQIREDKSIEDYIPGVFCDIFGTLLDWEGEAVNPTIYDLLKKFEAEGKKVTLWTGDEIGYAKAKLRSCGVKDAWPVVSKHSCAQKAVEVAIDDHSQEEFFGSYKIISVRTFYRCDYGFDDG